MRITEYIEALLYRYECVVLPKFGAFLAKRIPARIDSTTNTFYPPEKAVSFNRQLQENDGLLTQYIARAEEISYDQAVQKIYQFVQELRNALDSGEQVSIGTVGYFYTQADKILFQPSRKNNYLTEAFGTTSFISKPILRAQDGLITNPEETDEGLKNIEIFTEESVEQEVLTLNPKTKSRPNYWKYAAIGVVTIGLGGLLSLGWYSNQVKSYNKIAQQKAEQQIESQIQQATFILDEPLPLHTFKVNTPKAKGNYHIVAGAFREKANAEKQLKELKKKGFRPHYIGSNKYGLHQVVYESFTNRTEAIQALRNIRKNNPNAWILVKEL